MTARTRLAVRVRQSLFCRQCFIRLYPDARPLGTFHPDKAATCTSFPTKLLNNPRIHCALASECSCWFCVIHALAVSSKRMLLSCLLQRSAYCHNLLFSPSPTPKYGGDFCMLLLYAVCSGMKVLRAWEQLSEITVLKKRLQISI